MERVRFIVLVILAIGISAASTAYADTVMAQPEFRAIDQQQNNDGYPESRFGQAPGAPDLGSARGLTSRDAAEIDATMPSATSGSRSPASLMTEKEIQTQQQAQLNAQQINPIDVPIRDAQPTLPPPSRSVENSSLKGVQEIALIAGDLGFFPKTIFVSRDIPVRLFVTGASKNTLCIMMDSFQVRKQIRSQRIEEITFTAATPGKYRFYCPINGMEGTLIVKELSSYASNSNQ